MTSRERVLRNPFLKRNGSGHSQPGSDQCPRHGIRKLKQTCGDKLVFWGGAASHLCFRPVNCQDSGNSEAGFAQGAMQNSILR